MALVSCGSLNALASATSSSTETKASVKTAEFIAYLVVLAGSSSPRAVTRAGSHANDVLRANQVWLHAAIVTVGYTISRGLAKWRFRVVFPVVGLVDGSCVGGNDVVGFPGAVDPRFEGAVEAQVGNQAVSGRVRIQLASWPGGASGPM